MTEVTSIVSDLRKWGGITTDAILEPKTQIFTYDTLEGFIGYRLLGNSCVVLGDPVCPQEAMIPLTEAFHNYCNENSYRLSYLLASDQFKTLAMKTDCQVSLEIGEILYTDPHDNPFDHKGEKGSLVRRKCRRAEKNNVTVKEYLGNDSKTEEEILAVSKVWLQGKHKVRFHISDPEIFGHTEGKRWVYAECEGKVIGFLMLNKLESYQGYLLNHIMVLPDAPGGTPELLVIRALDILRSENCHYVTFGPVAREELGEKQGLGAISNTVVELLSKMFKKMVRHGGLNTFWGKFEPQSAPCYLLFADKKVSLKTIQNLMETLNFTL